jgi:hypothetical protein
MTLLPAFAVMVHGVLRLPHISFYLLKIRYMAFKEPYFWKIPSKDHLEITNVK